MIADFAFDSDLIGAACSLNLNIKEVRINWILSPSNLPVASEIGSMGIDILSIWYRFHLSCRQYISIYLHEGGNSYRRLHFILLSLTSKIDKRSETCKNNITYIKIRLEKLNPY
jgi:hypothetical protein